jgi:hypothetical protein
MDWPTTHYPWRARSSTLVMLSMTGLGYLPQTNIMI